MKGERGHALGLAVVVMLLATSAVGLLAADLTARLRADRAAGIALELRLLTDAAIARGLAELDESLSPTTLGPTPLGRGSIASHAEDLGAGRWRLVATATVGSAERRVAIEVVRQGSTFQTISWRRMADTKEN